jgi:hypothetical protein
VVVIPALALIVTAPERFKAPVPLFEIVFVVEEVLSVRVIERLLVPPEPTFSNVGFPP